MRRRCLDTDGKAYQMMILLRFTPDFGKSFVGLKYFVVKQLEDSNFTTERGQYYSVNCTSCRTFRITNIE